MRPLAIALLWVAQEALRDRTPFGGFPWARLAFSQADSPLVHLAALGGAPAVTFGVALVGAVAAAAVSRLGWAAHRPRPHRCATAAARSPAWAARCPSSVLAGALLLAPLLVPTPTDGTAGPVHGRPGERAPSRGWTSTPSAAPSSTTTSP